MKNSTLLKMMLFALLLLGNFSVFGQNAWINEIHYDNTGTDVDEFIEVVIENPSSYLLSDFSVTLYNGGDSTSYKKTTLNAFTQGSSYGNFTIFYYNYTANSSSIQNGAPDGMALDYQGTLIQFLSYEGSFKAKNGAASGAISTDIGVSENAEADGNSLQLSGTLGSNYSSFTWQAAATATMGTVNNNQTFNTSSGISQNKVASIVVSTANGEISFSANYGERVQVFSTIGEQLVNTIAKDGVNTIAINAKGLIIVKVGKETVKVVL